MNPKNVSKWEFAGVWAYPLVEALFAASVPARLGMSDEQFVSVLAGLFTLAAMIRALVQARSSTSGSSDVSDPEVLE